MSVNGYVFAMKLRRHAVCAVAVLRVMVGREAVSLTCETRQASCCNARIHDNTPPDNIPPERLPRVYTVQRQWAVCNGTKN